MTTFDEPEHVTRNRERRAVADREYQQRQEFAAERATDPGETT